MWIALATALSPLSLFCSRGVENVIIANSLRDADRATGFTSITALSMVPHIIIPLVAGVILTQLGGLLYTHVSPQAPFLFHMFVDVFIRIPLLLTMPRTLKATEEEDAVSPE